jgi:putative cell wall-binding protein/beta-lactamase superfamily II metal-dependent hydrolase
LFAIALTASLLSTPPASASGDALLAPLTVLQLSVGQNDAALFRGPCGAIGVVDVGQGAADDITDGLERLAPGSVSWVAATSYLPDHVGGIAELGGSIDIPIVYDRGGGPAAQDTVAYADYYAFAESRSHVALDIGAVLTLCPGPDEVTFTVVSAGTDGTAANGTSVEQESDRGLCFLVELHDFDMATCGDLSGTDEGARSDVESAVADELGYVEVLKVHQHGSGFSSNEAFLRRLAPQASIISTDTAPDPSVLARLEASGDVYTTQDQDVTVATSGDTEFFVESRTADSTDISALRVTRYPMDGTDPNVLSEGRPVAPPPGRPGGVTRFAGPDRYTTAAAVSAGSFPGTANDIFVVTGQDWPDALTAGAAAANLNGSVLPVQTDNIPAAISAEVDRLDPARAWVIGGTSAVNDTVLNDLRQRGIAVERVSGDDRHATGVAVLDRFFFEPSGAYYASAQAYPDALSGGAAAAARRWPLLLTAADAALIATPVVGAERIVIGGTAAVSDTVVEQLGARRVAGSDRFATSAAVALHVFPQTSTVYLATGLNYPDALAGTAAAARDDAPVLLARTDCVTAPVQQAAQSLDATSRVVLGGTSAVSARAADLALC